MRFLAGGCEGCESAFVYFYHMLRYTERILLTSFFNPAGSTMSRRYWSRMPGQVFWLSPPSRTDWLTWPRSHAGIDLMPALKMNLDCEFHKYDVMTMSVAGDQPKKHANPSCKARKHTLLISHYYSSYFNFVTFKYLVWLGDEGREVGRQRPVFLLKDPLTLYTVVQNLRSVKITDVAGVSNRFTNWRQHELPFFLEKLSELLRNRIVIWIQDPSHFLEGLVFNNLFSVRDIFFVENWL